MEAFYKNVLIISDNQFLCNEIFGVIQKHRFVDTAFSFAVSPFSNPELFKIDSVPPKVCDLRNTDDVDMIVASFDLVLSIHCKQIFPSRLVHSVKCINIHPGYNPINRGWYPQVFAIINKTPIGATIHEIDDAVDHGKIIAREFVEHFTYDTSESLYKRILAKEIELVDAFLMGIITNKYDTIEPENEGNLYLKKDFNALLQLNLDEESTVGETINKLRALTHGEFKNAFYIDPKTGKKIFVGIQFKPEDDE